MRKSIKAVALASSLLAAALTAQAVFAGQGTETSGLVDAVTDAGGANILAHLDALNDFGPRVPGSVEYDAAAGYVVDKLLNANYLVSLQPFDFDLWEELAEPRLEMREPSPSIIYDPDPVDPDQLPDFATMEYSGSGDGEYSVAVAAAFGCNPEDFDGNFSGKIAVIERGECTFFQKAQNAQDAGAAAVIVYNDELRQDAFNGTLGGPGITIPVVGSRWQVGQDLREEGARAYISVLAETTLVKAYNILAETQMGRDDRIVVVGAHLDTVANTTAMNDNGSGSATILEIALQMAELGIEPVNKVRFAFWSAEESGLIGSQYYVDQLSDRAKRDIALNLNFDMIASTNYGRFVYDGDGSDTETAGPNGSANIEKIFGDYFDMAGLAYEATAFDGRSDYGPFIEAGIPAGGLFAGADDIMTPAQADLFGGTAGIAFDINYHTAEDNLDNLNEQALEEMSGAAAHAVLTFAMTKSSVNGTAKAKSVAKGTMTYRGHKAQK